MSREMAPITARLEQRYERASDKTHAYTSASTGYRGLHDVDGSGFVRVYPTLWRAVS